MNTTTLREIIAQALPAWDTTINEQYMMNVQADSYERFQGFIYVEEMATAKVTYDRWNKHRYTLHDVYFCVLDEFDTTAEQREAVREQRIRPAVNQVEGILNQTYNVSEFEEDYFPRGFDANEILIHIRFKAWEAVGC